MNDVRRFWRACGPVREKEFLDESNRWTAKDWEEWRARPVEETVAVSAEEEFNFSNPGAQARKCCGRCARTVRAGSEE